MEDKDVVYSKKLKAGKRTYFMDVKLSRNRLYYVTVTESVKQHENNDDDPEFKKFRVIVYPEDFNNFLDSLTEVIDHVRYKLMPDFDYDKFKNS